jgi:hypothetical protein
MLTILFLLRAGVCTLSAERATIWYGAWQDILDPYRPELYYMRGPGPKWREKHESSAAVAA